MPTCLIQHVNAALLIAVPGLYVVRAQDQRPLRGRWLVAISVVVATFPALVWYLAMQFNLGPSIERLAIETTVPLAQLAIVVLSLRLFQTLFGRPPARFTFQDERQDNCDTLMHGLMLFVMIAGMFAVASLRR